MTARPTDADLAAARQLEEDSGEIVAIVTQNIRAAVEREGREFQLTDLRLGIEVMLAAAWNMARLVHGDEAAARRAYVEFLRRHADGVERLG